MAADCLPLCQPECDAWCLFARLVPVVSWLIVIGGWWVVSRDNNKREHRKEVRASLDAAAVDIRDVEAAAHEYFIGTTGGTPESASCEVRIKARLQRLGWKLDMLRLQEGMDTKAEMIQFRRGVTGSGFEGVDRKPLMSGAARIAEVSEDAEALITRLETLFRGKYPN